MSYPLIILGAGASFDYINEQRATRDKTWKPPLSRELFDARFSGFKDQFPEVSDLSSSVTADIDRGISLEDSLRRLKKFPERTVQLAMFEFYLQELFYRISGITNGYGGQHDNNYQRLAQQISDGPKKAIVVNFNYDSLFENSLGFEIRSTEDNIKNDIKIIKVHGSCDWRYILRKRDYGPPSLVMQEQNIVRNDPTILESLKREPYPHHVKHLLGDQDYYKFPAIAIPLPDKNDFVCPKAHIDVLKEELKKIDRVLIIGWSANDPYMVSLIKNLTQPIALTVVSSRETTDSIFEKFADCPNISPQKKPGFSNYMSSNECLTFFGTA